nr:hypothetical protein [uncultured Duganella sp.]
MKKLFRAVSAQEKNDIIATNSYRMHPSMPTGTKYFVETEAEGRHIQSVFTMTDIFNDGPYCLSFGHFDKALPNKVFIAGKDMPSC